MAGEIRSDPDILRGHARGVTVIAEDLDDALAAARSVDLSGGAFGVLCAFLVPRRASPRRWRWPRCAARARCCGVLPRK